MSWSRGPSFRRFPFPTRPWKPGSTVRRVATMSCFCGENKPDEADPPPGRGADPVRHRGPRDPLAGAGAVFGGELPLGLLAAAGAGLLRLSRHDRLDGLAVDSSLRAQSSGRA